MSKKIFDPERLAQIDKTLEVCEKGSIEEIEYTFNKKSLDASILFKASPHLYDPLFEEQVECLRPLLPEGMENLLDNDGLLLPDDDRKGFTLISIKENGRLAAEIHIGEFKNLDSIWRKNNLASEKPVFITRNRSDAMVLECLGYPAISIGDKVTEFVELLRGRNNGEIPPMILYLGRSEGSDVLSKKLHGVMSRLTETVEWSAGFGNAYEAFIASADFSNGIARSDFTKALDAACESAELISVENDDEHSQPFESSSVATTATSILDKCYSSEPPDLISTGLEVVDSMLSGGLEPNSLILLAAESSIGKTSLCVQMALANAANGCAVFFLEMDDSAEQINLKMVSNTQFMNWVKAGFKSRIGQYTDIRSPFDIRYKASFHTELQRKGVYDAGDTLTKNGRELFVVTTGNELAADGNNRLTTGSLETALHNYRSCIDPDKPIVVYVDYVQRLRPDISDEELSRLTDKLVIDNVMGDLSRMAKQYGATIIAVSSINRMSYGTPITLGSMKESGDLEYDADAVLALQPAGLKYPGEEKDTVVRKNNIQIVQGFRNNNEPYRKVELRLLKHRHARLGYVELYNNPTFGAFLESVDGAMPIFEGPNEMMQKRFRDMG